MRRVSSFVTPFMTACVAASPTAQLQTAINITHHTRHDFTIHMNHASAGYVSCKEHESHARLSAGTAQSLDRWLTWSRLEHWVRGRGSRQRAKHASLVGANMLMCKERL